MDQRRSRPLGLVPPSVSRLLRTAFTMWAVVLTVLCVRAEQREPLARADPSPGLSDASTGEAIYRAACVTCHAFAVPTRSDLLVQRSRSPGRL